MTDQSGLVRIADVTHELGLSPSRIRQLADAGVIPSTRTAGGHRLFDLAAVRDAIARKSLLSEGSAAQPTEPSWRHELTLLGLSESDVWQRVKRDLDLPSDTRAGRILVYAFTEMLNNAIDHSESATVVISVWISEAQWSFEIRDFGVGVFAKLSEGLRLGSDLEALQELSKGKRTTSPQFHTGEGIFFTSKLVDFFRLTSSGVRWTVDNLREDQALGIVPSEAGTKIECQIDPRTERSTTEVFRQFSEEHEFVRTRPVVKLFGIGTPFVSRSEARRLLDGLDEDFEIVEVDFTGVIDVGQGFIDELLRVWPSTHPSKTVIPIKMNEAVEFMVNRARRR
jgi:anti-sigma regulatory factor (Ser/Thr protein kinase)